jgi:hypothetical protein
LISGIGFSPDGFIDNQRRWRRLSHHPFLG